MTGPISIERTFSQSDFDRFADLSGDHNPIHVDPDFSKQARFGSTVAHGLLLITVLRGLIERLHPGARQTHQTIVFPAPTFADEPMRFTVVEKDADGEQRTLTLRVSRVADGTVTCEGEATIAPGEARS